MTKQTALLLPHIFPDHPPRRAHRDIPITSAPKSTTGPAKEATARKEPVEERMLEKEAKVSVELTRQKTKGERTHAPEIGGPISAAIARQVVSIPRRRPRS